jgi:hypothetical protein
VLTAQLQQGTPATYFDVVAVSPDAQDALKRPTGLAKTKWTHLP